MQVVVKCIYCQVLLVTDQLLAKHDNQYSCHQIQLLSKSWEPCSFHQVQDFPRRMTSTIPRAQEKGTQICMTACRQGFTLIHNVSRSFILCSTPPSQGTTKEPQYVQMYSQGVMSSNKAGNYPELHSVKGY